MAEVKNFSRLRFLDDNGEAYPDWEMKTLGEVGKWSRGVGLPKSEICNDGKYKCVHYGELFASGSVIKPINTTNLEGKRKSKYGDVLIPGSDVTPNGLARASAILYDDVVLGGDINILSPKSDYNSIFLSYSIISRAREIINLVVGTTVKHITPTRLSGLFIPVPSLPEQEKIAGFLSALDENIEANEELLELLKLEKTGYLHKIFNRELRFMDENGEAYPDWEMKKLGEMIDTGKAGGTPKTTDVSNYNGDIPFLGISDITSAGKYVSKTEKTLTDKGLKESAAWLVPANSLLYAMYASVGKMCFNKVPLATSQAIFAMTMKDSVDQGYIYYALDNFNSNHLFAILQTGTQSNISAALLRSILIPVPSLAEQEKIAGFLSALDDRIEAQSHLVSTLKEEKKAYLQRIFG